MKKLLLFTLVLFTALFSIQTASAQHWAQVKTEADELKGTRAQSAQYIKVPGEGMAFLNDKTDALTFYTYIGTFDFEHHTYNGSSGLCGIYDENGKLVYKCGINIAGSVEQLSIAVALKSSGLSKVISWIRYKRGSVRIILPRFGDSDFDITVPTFLSQRQSKGKSNGSVGHSRNRKY